MTRPLIVLVGLVYTYIAVESGVKGNLGLAIVYAGYALANIGMWMLASS